MGICGFLFAIFLILKLLLSSIAQPLHNSVNLSTVWNTKYGLYYQPILVTYTDPIYFSCGFSCYTDFCKTYLFSVYIFAYGEPNESGQVVWSANRDHPVQQYATLHFTAAGELVLKDVNGSIVWTTNTAGKSVVGMNLTDTGNLVLFDDKNLVVWQSFDHPTDSLLLGQKLLEGQKLKSSVSLKNLSGGMFSLQYTDKGVFAYVESNPPQAYFDLFYNLNSDDRHIGRRYLKFMNGSLASFIHSSKPSDPDDSISIPEASSAQYMKLNPDGHLQVFEHLSQGWTMVTDITAKFLDECSYPLVCGYNSICSTDKQCSCPGINYFRSVTERQPNLGCSEITPLRCNFTQDQVFITLENVDYFTVNTSTADKEGVNRETCKKACLHNCSCKAAFFRYDFNPSSGDCFLLSELFTMKTTSPSFYTFSAFIKVQNVTSPPLSPRVHNVTSPPLSPRVHNVTSPPFSPQVQNVTSPTSSNEVTRVVVPTIVGFALVLLVVIGFIKCIAQKRKRDVEIEEDLLDQVPGMPTRFYYDELKTATENFSKKLGEGGFGSVFEGSLKDGTTIAVKCLEGLSHVKKSFLAEVQSIGSIHHVNLVRLKGFCTWKSQRFLVYDFMSNGSLDKWIYHGNQEHILEWKCKKKIILDVAKGLAYLHEECRLKIIHLDIKPQNILLDEGFNAKVSDFGLSKLMDRNQTQVMTTMRGTPGYMAPEWLSSIITEKVDVYSFGIVLLEILCGRKNFDRSQPEESWHLLRVFQKCWEQGTLLDIVDMSSEDKQRNGIEVMEMMKMASWCLQTDYTKRPLMSSVVKVLEGETTVESNLDYNFTDPRLQKNDNQEKDSTPMPSSILSGPR